MDLHHPELIALHALWRDTAAFRLPAFRDLPDARLSRWTGHLSLLRAVGTQQRLYVKRASAAAVELVGFDPTGRHLDEIADAVSAELLVPPCTRVLQTATAHCHRFDLDRRPPKVVHRLLLPIAADGCLVDHILAGVYIELKRVEAPSAGAAVEARPAPPVPAGE